jgi:hypothetical protein
VIVYTHQGSRQNKNRTYTNWDSKSIKKENNTRAHRSLRLLLELERSLDSTLNSRQGFSCAATTTKLKPLQVENYKMSTVCQLSPRRGIYRGEWDLHQLGEVGLVPCGGLAAKPRGRLARRSGLHRLSPPTQVSPPRVAAWQPRLRSNRLKPC